MTMPARARPRYTQANSLRDFTLALYLFNPLTIGIQHLALGGGQDQGSGSALNQAITLFMFASAVLCAAYERVTLGKLWRGAAPFAIVVALVVVSYLWADHAGISMRRIARFALEVVGLVVLASCYRDSRSLLRVLWLVFAAVVALDIAAVALPRISMTSIGYAGIHSHKNTLGSFCYIALPVFFYAWRLRLQGQWSFLNILLMLATLGLLGASLSKTSAFVLPFIGLITLAAYKVWRRGGATRVALVGFFSACAILLVVPIAGSGKSIPELVGEVTGDPTMTGRTPLWEYIIYRVGDRYMTGVGYGSFWDVDRSGVALMNEFGITFNFEQAHNGYLGVYAELGAPGVAAILLMWLLATAGIVRRIDNAREWALIGFALYLSLAFVLYNITESAFLRVGLFAWIMFVLISAAAIKIVAPITTSPPPNKQSRAKRATRRPAPFGAPTAQVTRSVGKLP